MMPSSLSLDQRKALVRQYLKIIWDVREADEQKYTPLAQIDSQQNMHSSYADTVNFFASPPCTYFGSKRLLISHSQACQIMRKTFPDIHFMIIDLFGEEEKIVVRWIIQGTDLGGYKDHLPTGRAINITGISIFRLEQRNIIEEWIEADLAGMFDQLGFVLHPQPPRITMRRPANISHL